jgi:hypothetical protein
MTIKIDPRDVDEFVRGLVLGTKMFVEATFAESQLDVPVVKGILKQSGEEFETADGAEIDYHAPYAYVREHVVPKVTKQKPPRGTYYTERALKTTMAKLGEYIVKGISLTRLALGRQ